ncbi:MAG: alginate lyase family protein [Clostridia bacterium]|nr:alginate lyase family protein [Clostridia bacterium]
MTKTKKIISFGTAGAALVAVAVFAGIYISNNFGKIAAKEFNSQYFGFTREYYNYTGDADMIESEESWNRDMSRWAELTSQGKMVVNSRLPDDYYEFTSPAEIDWNAVCSDSPNTFSLYFQSLCCVQYLSAAYENTGNESYLDLAREIIDSWNRFDENKELSAQNKYIWYDHAMALRTDNLIYFMTVYEQSGKLDEDYAEFFRSLLQRHVDMLSDEDRYTKNHNHGIFQDQALIYAAYFLNDDNSRANLRLALDRLKAQKEFAYTEEMVHVENSPGYAYLSCKQFTEIADFLKILKCRDGADFIADLDQAKKYMAWVTLPNGNYAMMGDTDNKRDIKKQRGTNGQWQYINKTITNIDKLEKAGGLPKALSEIYPKSGYYYSRSTWDTDEFYNSTWACFKSGYRAKTHKHADDTSFMMYSKGYEIFSDSGFYNYMPGNKYKDYLASALAHNVVTVDDGSYSVCAEHSGNTGIIDYKLGKDYDYVLGYNDMYDGVSIDRHFYNFGDAIVIFDDIVSSEEHTYSQLFHFSEFITDVKAENGELVGRIGDSGCFVRIRQFGACDCNLIYGRNADPKYLSVISREINGIEDIYTCIYSTSGTNAQFATVITVEDANGNVITDYKTGKTAKYTDFNIDTAEGKISAAGKSADIKTRARCGFENVTITANKSSVILSNPNEVDYPVEYGWDMYNGAGEIVASSEFSKNDGCTLKFEGEGKFYVVSKIKYPYDSVKRKMVGVIWAKDGNSKDISDQFDCLNLKYNGYQFEKTEDNKYRVSLSFDYSGSTGFRWYLYKNGSGVQYDITAEPFFEYTIEEPGTYSVIFYIRTTDGQNYCYNTEEFEVK